VLGSTTKDRTSEDQLTWTERVEEGQRDLTDVVCSAFTVQISELDALTSAGSTGGDNVLPIPLECASRTWNRAAVIPSGNGSVQHIDVEKVVLPVTVDVCEPQV